MVSIFNYTCIVGNCGWPNTQASGTISPIEKAVTSVSVGDHPATRHRPQCISRTNSLAIAVPPASTASNYCPRIEGSSPRRPGIEVVQCAVCIVRTCALAVITTRNKSTTFRLCFLYVCLLLEHRQLQPLHVERRRIDWTLNAIWVSLQTGTSLLGKPGEGSGEVQCNLVIFANFVDILLEMLHFPGVQQTSGGDECGEAVCWHGGWWPLFWPMQLEQQWTQGPVSGDLGN